jgi:DNA polymerase-3 subunit alpha
VASTNCRPAERRKYREAAAYEVDLIEQKGYENYFLIVADAIVYVKNQGIPVGPARGSAAGSLAAFVLRITEIDPIKFPLLIFERFIDVTREDLTGHRHRLPERSSGPRDSP